MISQAISTQCIRDLNKKSIESVGTCFETCVVVNLMITLPLLISIFLTGIA